MRMSYNKLWKLLIDKKMKKSDLRKNTFDIEKNTNDENVTTDVLAKICNALKCNVFDIMEFIPDEESEESV